MIFILQKILALSAVFTLSAAVPAAAQGYTTSYLFGGTATQYEGYVTSSGGVVDNVCPDYFEIGPDGSLKIAKMDAKFIAAMHAKGVTVTPYLSNNWDKALGVAALANTEGLTAALAKAVRDNGLDGVDVDIENVNETYKAAYTDFVKSLRAKMPDKTLSVAVAANPKNWQTGWHGSYDYAALAQNSDYLLIMAYDESYYGGPAGPVASSAFVEQSIQYALSKTTADKLVLGLPFFGRYWKEGSTVGGSGITAMDVENLRANYKTTKTFYPATQSAKVVLTLTAQDIPPKLWGGAVLTPGTYEIWYNDLTSVAYALGLADKYKLRGTGSWAMGQEDKNVWPVYASFKATPAPPPTGVKLPWVAVTLSPGETKQLTATVSPPEASQSVTWKSSNTAVATVDSAGLVKAVASGSATVTATAADGTKSAACIVTVTVPVTGVKVSAVVKVGASLQLEGVFTPSNATNKAVIWTSDNPGVAAITGTGVVTGIKPGVATITGAARDGGKLAVITVTVR